MEVTVVIPARLASTRLPNKVLADIHGHPLLWHVWQQTQRMREATGIVVPTDADEVRLVVENWGGKVLMTSPDCQSGTERIGFALRHLKGDYILNVQRDEPFIAPALLDEIIMEWKENNWELVTLST